MTTRMVGARPARRRLLVRVLAGLAVLVAVAVLALLVSRRGGDDDTDRRDALAAARAAAVDLTTYDHASLDRDFAWAERGATASFARHYQAANEPLRKVIGRLDADAVGRVVDAVATVRTQRRVAVVMSVDQTITSSADATPRVRHDRITMTMVERDGRWLVDDVRLR